MANLIGEIIHPIGPTADLAALNRREPGLPDQFKWRGQTYPITEVIKSWKSAGLGIGATSEKYLRKHWYLVKTEDGQLMTIYFDRQPKRRYWVLYSIE